MALNLFIFNAVADTIFPIEEISSKDKSEGKLEKICSHDKNVINFRRVLQSEFIEGIFKMEGKLIPCKKIIEDLDPLAWRILVPEKLPYDILCYNTGGEWNPPSVLIIQNKKLILRQGINPKDCNIKFRERYKQEIEEKIFTLVKRLASLEDEKNKEKESVINEIIKTKRELNSLENFVTTFPVTQYSVELPEELVKKICRIWERISEWEDGENKVTESVNFKIFQSHDFYAKPEKSGFCTAFISNIGETYIYGYKNRIIGASLAPEYYKFYEIPKNLWRCTQCMKTCIESKNSKYPNEEKESAIDTLSESLEIMGKSLDNNFQNKD